ncbi:MAG TPA: peptidoglycan-associated lipoprotein Pal [Steroidobacteraceae bacterium]|nr:peptidoglycan-associated lipoprotein Pal [Steroidobacteraceae bacterium]
MKRLTAMTLLLSGAMLLAACHGKSAVKEPASSASEVPTNAAAGGAGTTMTPLGGGNSGSLQAIAQAGNDAPLDQRTIYFDFDRSEIKPQYDAVIAAYAKMLTANPGLKIRLEGNTDDRGSREYNIGLGERRAQAVRRALMLQGVADAQITTVSYGAERPAVEGDNAAAWAMNRRVDMVYQP